MNANPVHIFFCGSIPLEHEVDVFNALAEIGGDRLRRVSDGELGDRKMWVIGQYAVLAACPALQFGPFPAEGLTRRTCYQIPLRLRPDKILVRDAQTVVATCDVPAKELRRRTREIVSRHFTRSNEFYSLVVSAFQACIAACNCVDLSSHRITTPSVFDLRRASGHLR